MAEGDKAACYRAASLLRQLHVMCTGPALTLEEHTYLLEFLVRPFAARLLGPSATAALRPLSFQFASMLRWALRDRWPSQRSLQEGQQRVREEILDVCFNLRSSNMTEQDAMAALAFLADSSAPLQAWLSRHDGAAASSPLDSAQAGTQQATPTELVRGLLDLLAPRPQRSSGVSGDGRDAVLWLLEEAVACYAVGSAGSSTAAPPRAPTGAAAAALAAADLTPLLQLWLDPLVVVDVSSPKAWAAMLLPDYTPMKSWGLRGDELVTVTWSDGAVDHVPGNDMVTRTPAGPLVRAVLQQLLAAGGAPEAGAEDAPALGVQPLAAPGPGDEQGSMGVAAAAAGVGAQPPLQVFLNHLSSALALQQQQRGLDGRLQPNLARQLLQKQQQHAAGCITLELLPLLAGTAAQRGCSGSSSSSQQLSALLSSVVLGRTAPPYLPAAVAAHYARVLLDPASREPLPDLALLCKLWLAQPEEFLAVWIEDAAAALGRPGSQSVRRAATAGEGSGVPAGLAQRQVLLPKVVAVRVLLLCAMWQCPSVGLQHASAGLLRALLELHDAPSDPWPPAAAMGSVQAWPTGLDGAMRSCMQRCAEAAAPAAQPHTAVDLVHEVMQAVVAGLGPQQLAAANALQLMLPAVAPGTIRAWQAGCSARPAAYAGALAGALQAVMPPDGSAAAAGGVAALIEAASQLTGGAEARACRRALALYDNGSLLHMLSAALASLHLERTIRLQVVALLVRLCVCGAAAAGAGGGSADGGGRPMQPLPPGADDSSPAEAAVSNTINALALRHMELVLEAPLEALETKEWATAVVAGSAAPARAAMWRGAPAALEEGPSAEAASLPAAPAAAQYIQAVLRQVKAAGPDTADAPQPTQPGAARHLLMLTQVLVASRGQVDRLRLFAACAHEVVELLGSAEQQVRRCAADLLGCLADLPAGSPERKALAAAYGSTAAGSGGGSGSSVAAAQDAWAGSPAASGQPCSIAAEVRQAAAGSHFLGISSDRDFDAASLAVQQVQASMAASAAGSAPLGGEGAAALEATAATAAGAAGGSGLVLTATTLRNLQVIDEAAACGQPLLLSGATGVGKSASIAHVARKAGTRAIRVNMSDKVGGAWGRVGACTHMVQCLDPGMMLRSGARTPGEIRPSLDRCRPRL